MLSLVATTLRWSDLLDFCSAPLALLLLAVALLTLLFFHRIRVRNFNTQLLLLEASIRYQEEERKKLSANLHDDAGPLLATARLYLNDQLLQQDRESQAQTIATARSIIDEAIELVRSISHEQLPPTLKNFGLHSAIKDLVRKIDGAGVVSATVQFNPFEKRYTEDKEMMIYRIVLELLNNILKHSRASFIDIEQRWHHDRYLLLLLHDGKGLTQPTFDELSHQSGGIGLKNIAGRIRLLQGSIHFAKEANKDVYSIKISIP